MKALNHQELSYVIKDISGKINTTYISNILTINSTDIVMSFSFYRKEKLIISLDHNSPFISLIDKDEIVHSSLNHLSENLRKLIANAFIKDIKQVTNDRIILISLTKNNEFFEKIELYIVIELIPHASNLLILNDDLTIAYAYHYNSIDSIRPIVKGLKYYYPKINETQILNNKFDLKNYYQETHMYVSNAEIKNNEEKYLPILKEINKRLKVAKNKVGKLEKDYKKSSVDLNTKEMAETILTLKDSKDELNNYLKQNNVPYDSSLSPIENSNLLFKKYKKSKSSVLNLTIQIENTNASISNYEHDIDLFKTGEEIIMKELANKYTKTKRVSEIKTNTNTPYIAIIDNLKIAYGKNANQNEYLTFKLADKSYYFLHVHNRKGNHVIILKNNPSDEDIYLAAQATAYLSKLEACEIELVKVCDLKKSKTKGLVIFSKYQLIKINNIEEKVKLAINNSFRY